MSFAADVGRFYKNWMKGSYEFGKRASNTLTRNMDPGKARTVGAAVDVVAGVGLTGLFGFSTLTYVGVACLAVAGVVTAPATIPAALFTVGTAILFGGLGALMTGSGIGFLSAAKDKLNIPTPKGVAAKVNNAAQSAVQAVTKPFKWAGNKLSHTFRKAHDGASAVPKAAANNAQPKAASYKF